MSPRKPPAKAPTQRPVQSAIAVPGLVMPVPAPVAVPEKKEMPKKTVLSPDGTLGFRLPVKKKANTILSFIASLNYIGMGKERTQFVQSLAMLLNAGLSLIEALKTIQLEIRQKSMKKIVQAIVDAVESGTPLWVAMDDRHFFTPYAIALVRIGEEAGNMAQNMEYLALQQEKDAELKGKVKMAMIYPAIVLVLMFTLVMGLGIFVLPNLVSVLFALNAKLPLSTKILIMFSNFFSKHSVLAVSSTVGTFLGLFLLNALCPPATRVIQWIIFRIPGIGRLAREATIARFGVILGGLLRAGVPLVEAMRSLTAVTTMLAYKSMYQKLTDDINMGQSFRQCFEEIHAVRRLLPQSVQSLVVVGERSGSLSNVLLKIADIYDKKATETAQKLPVILEPVLLMFIGGLVGFIAISIIVPIYSVVGSIGNQ